jgi:serine/threonine-protein kinase RsbW
LKTLARLNVYHPGSPKAGLDDEACYAVELAVDEAATNIIEHGYGRWQGYVGCSYEILRDGIRIVLKDHGRQFDPNSVPVPSFHGFPGRCDSARLGLYFIRKLMDEVKL